MIWRCRDFHLDPAKRVLVMGILNVTPDSFSDGGRWADPEAAVARAYEMAEQGADIIDIGGESTRPGAEPVDAEEEIRRVAPVIKRLAPRLRTAAISIDTMKYETAKAALDAGADIINDVSALGFDKRMARLAADSGAGLVLMHMRGDPRTMQAAPVYGDVVAEISEFLLEREALAIERGVGRDQIAFDPGLGFGKTLAHNLEIFRRLGDLAQLGRPLLVGASRKSFVRKLAGVEAPPDSPEAHAAVMEANAATVAVAVAKGAAIVRVHDVAQMRRAADVARGLCG